MVDGGGARGADREVPKFFFSVDLGDGRPLGFAEVGGLESDVKPIEYRHGDSKVFSSIKMPGLRSVGNVTLKKGVVGKDSVLWDWLAETKLDIVKRRTVTIDLLDELGAAKMSWTLTNAWPIKVSRTDPKSDAQEVAVETLEIAYETITVKAA